MVVDVVVQNPKKSMVCEYVKENTYEVLASIAE